MEHPAVRRRSSRTPAASALASRNNSDDASPSPYSFRRRASKVDYAGQQREPLPVEKDLVPVTPSKRPIGRPKKLDTGSPCPSPRSEIVQDLSLGPVMEVDATELPVTMSPFGSRKKDRKKKKDFWKCEIIVGDNDSNVNSLEDRESRVKTISGNSASLQSPVPKPEPEPASYQDHHPSSSSTISTPKTIKKSKSIFSQSSPSKSKTVDVSNAMMCSPVSFRKGTKVLQEKVNNVDERVTIIGSSDSLQGDDMDTFPVELDKVLVTKSSLDVSLENFMQKSNIESALRKDEIYVAATTTPASLPSNSVTNTPVGDRLKNVDFSTPTRSSKRLHAESTSTTADMPSVVRRLDSSLSEVSSSSKDRSTVINESQRQRPKRNVQRKSYSEDYFGVYDDSSDESRYDDNDDVPSASDTDSSDHSDSHASDTDVEMDDEKIISASGPHTPSKTLRIGNPTLCLTPKVVQAVSRIATNDFSPRRTPDIKNVRNTPTSESFFTAEKRIRFKSEQAVKKLETIRKVKESKKGPKKPRKGNRQGIDKALASLPLVAPNFSVTKELAKISVESMESADYVSPWQEEHGEVLELLHQEIARDFPRWIILLREGFNIMLHGYGSKHPIYDAFSEFLASKFLVVSINGLFPKFYPRKFLINLMENLDLDCDIKFTGSSINCIAENVLAELSQKKRSPVFIYAMNLDIMAARHHQMLTCICALAQVPWIHIIASSDHVNTGLGISPLENLQLNMAWLDCTTFVPYSNELMWNSNILGAGVDGNAAKSSIEHIFKSLTSNSKKAFGLLAGLQLQKLKSRGKRAQAKTFQGVEFRELFRVCREAFIAHSELVLKSLLTEFIDHKLIHYSGRGKHDDNFLVIDLDENTLERYVDS